MLAAGDGFTETGTEPASIDAVASLPVGDAPASPETLARAVAAVESETLDLPVELNEPVLSCIDLYQGRLRPWFETALSRGQQYLPHIREVFAEEGIPQDLAYVALVESAFKTTAYSRAKAKGVWQFISATGKRYGLAVDWWVDERSDPEKATRAAARYLKDLYALFGDWNLALAGYNAGEGKVLRAIRRYKTDDFWELRKTRGLRRETKNYVPLIHAAVVLAKAPERYGFTVTPDEPPDFERVPIEGAIDLRVIAECAGEPVEGDPHPEPRAAAARHPRRPHLLAARPARPGAGRGGVRRGPAAREAGELPQARGAARPDVREHRPGQRHDRPRRGRGQQPAAAEAPAAGHRADHPDPREAAGRPGPPARPRRRRPTDGAACATASSPATRWARSRPSTGRRCATSRPRTACAGRGSRPATSSRSTPAPPRTDAGRTSRAPPAV